MLMTAAPRSIAVAIRSAERAQLIDFGSGTLSALAPGHTPTIPTPFTGAAATDAVAVPCEAFTGSSGSVLVAPPTNSGCAGSSWLSTSAISGLVGVTAGGTRAGSTIPVRQSSGGTVSGSTAAAARLSAPAVSGS